MSVVAPCTLNCDVICTKISTSFIPDACADAPVPCVAQLPVPDTLDVLLVEQEVVGTDQSALEVCAGP